MQERDGGGLSGPALRSLAFLILTALVTVVVVAQQRGSGAFVAEFSATRADEAGHVVTGLMVKDYLAAGLPAPLAFIADYALRLPRVVLGLDAPLYYLAEGIWLSALGVSTPAVLLLPAVLAALLVVTAGWVASRFLGALPGVAVGAALIALPAVRETTIVVGLDLPLALACLLATLSYGRYLARGGWRDGALFGLLAAAAMLIKGTGILLLLLPPLALLATGRFGLARRGSFWLPFLIAGVLAGPWTLGTLPMVLAAAPQPAGAAFAAAAARAYGAGAVAALDGVLVVLAGIGGVSAVVRAWRGRAEAAGPATLAALIVAAAIVLCALPLAPDPRALLPVLAPMVILAAAGGMDLLGLVTSGWSIVRGLMVALVLLLAAMPALLRPVMKPATGMDELAQLFLARTAGNPVILVVADAAAEGALIAAVAQRDAARQSFVVPADLVFTAQGPGPDAGAALYGDPQSVLAAIEGLAPSFVAVDTAPASRQRPYFAAVAAAMAADPDRFRLLGGFPRGDGTGEARLYALAAPATPADPAATLRRLHGGRAP